MSNSKYSQCCINPNIIMIPTVPISQCSQPLQNNDKTKVQQTSKERHGDKGINANVTINTDNNINKSGMKRKYPKTVPENPQENPVGSQNFINTQENSANSVETVETLANSSKRPSISPKLIPNKNENNQTDIIGTISLTAKDNIINSTMSNVNTKPRFDTNLNNVLCLHENEKILSIVDKGETQIRQEKINNKINTNAKLKSHNLKFFNRNFTKIHLTINITTNHDEREGNMVNESKEGEVDIDNDSNSNSDLSFLDDFNVDEIVKTLNDSVANKQISSDINTNNTKLSESKSQRYLKYIKKKRKKEKRAIKKSRSTFERDNNCGGVHKQSSMVHNVVPSSSSIIKPSSDNSTANNQTNQHNERSLCTNPQSSDHKSINKKAITRIVQNYNVNVPISSEIKINDEATENKNNNKETSNIEILESQNESKSKFERDNNTSLNQRGNINSPDIKDVIKINLRQKNNARRRKQLIEKNKKKGINKSLSNIKMRLSNIEHSAKFLFEGVYKQSSVAQNVIPSSSSIIKSSSDNLSIDNQTNKLNKSSLLPNLQSSDHKSINKKPTTHIVQNDNVNVPISSGMKINNEPKENKENNKKKEALTTSNIEILQSQKLMSKLERNNNTSLKQEGNIKISNIKDVIKLNLTQRNNVRKSNHLIEKNKNKAKIKSLSNCIQIRLSNVEDLTKSNFKGVQKQSSLVHNVMPSSSSIVKASSDNSTANNKRYKPNERSLITDQQNSVHKSINKKQTTRKFGTNYNVNVPKSSGIEINNEPKGNNTKKETVNMHNMRTVSTKKMACKINSLSNHTQIPPSNIKNASKSIYGGVYKQSLLVQNVMPSSSSIIKAMPDKSTTDNEPKKPNESSLFTNSQGSEHNSINKKPTNFKQPLLVQNMVPNSNSVITANSDNLKTIKLNKSNLFTNQQSSDHRSINKKPTATLKQPLLVQNVVPCTSSVINASSDNSTAVNQTIKVNKSNQTNQHKERSLFTNQQSSDHKSINKKSTTTLKHPLLVQNVVPSIRNAIKASPDNLTTVNQINYLNKSSLFTNQRSSDHNSINKKPIITLNQPLLKASADNLTAVNQTNKPNKSNLFTNQKGSNHKSINKKPTAILIVNEPKKNNNNATNELKDISGHIAHVNSSQKYKLNNQNINNRKSEKDTDFTDNKIKSTYIASSHCDKVGNISIKDSNHESSNKIGPSLDLIMKCPNNTAKNNVTSKETKNSSNMEHAEENILKKDLLTDDYMIKHLENRISEVSYKQCKVLGMIKKGYFSKIFKYKNGNGQDMAVKVLRPNRDFEFRKEKMLQKLQSELSNEKFHCVKVFSGFSLFKSHWCLIMEYLPKNLIEALKENKGPFQINNVQNLSRQLITAVMILRTNDIIHSDISPSHILLNSTNTCLKLGGFDNAQYSSKDMMINNACGIVQYRAPEVILKYSSGHTIDVWSTACVLFEMATNRMLFTERYVNDVLYQQKKLLDNGSVDKVSRFGIIYTERITWIQMQRQNEAQINTHQHGINLKTLITDTYLAAQFKNEQYKDSSEEAEKLQQFAKLLSSMLVLNPEKRLAIELAYANPFIYPKF